MTFVPRSISIVIPTYQRREIVCESVRRLDKVTSPIPLDVVVVVDGSNDGSVAALEALTPRWPTKVLFHENRGLAATRNRGARSADGDVIIFIDDDMRADPDLIDGHLAAYAEGADAVVGRMTLDPTSPDTILADQVGEWCDELAEGLAAKQHITNGHDVFGGHLSIRRTLFEQLDGFEESFNRDGRYGNEDLDFGDRLIASGANVLYSAQASTAQHYAVSASQRIDQWHDLASADEQLLESAQSGDADVQDRQRTLTITRPQVRRLIDHAPGLVRMAAKAPRAIICRRIDAGHKDARTNHWFGQLLRLHYTLGRSVPDNIPSRSRPISSGLSSVIRSLRWRRAAVAAAVRMTRFRNSSMAATATGVLRTFVGARSQQDVIIISAMRTGSTLLCGLAEQLPGVGTTYESLNRDGVHHLRSAHEAAAFIRIVSSPLQNDDIIVTKVFHEHLEGIGQWSDLQREFPDAKWIHLYREDLLLQYVSLIRAQSGSKWIVAAEDAAPTVRKVAIDWETFEAFRDATIKSDQAAADAFRSSPDYVTLSYEELAADPANVLATVVAPLIGRQVTGQESIPFQRTGAEDHASSIANWDEIAPLINSANVRHPGVG